MENKKTKKIHRDKNGREYFKEAFFVGGKMKFHRIYVIDGIPADEFYIRNATDVDFYMNGDFALMSCGHDSDSQQNKIEIDSRKSKGLEDLPF